MPEVESVKLCECNHVPAIENLYPNGENNSNRKSGKIKILCDQCGNNFFRYPSQKRAESNFCSRACWALFRSINLIGEKAVNWKGKTLKVTCDYCKKEFYKPKQQIENAKHIFCSCECHGLWNSANLIGIESTRWNGGKIKVQCQQCGKDFYKKPSRIKVDKKNFCSNECHGVWKSTNLIGENSSNWQCGEVAVNCDQCGKQFNKNLNKVKKDTHNFCSRSCDGLWKSLNKRGEDSPGWRGGISDKGYCTTWTDSEFKSYILQRDNYKCQNPDCYGTSKKLVRHHIDYNKERCSPDNIIVLCNSCNSRANGNREWHTAFYHDIMIKNLNSYLEKEQCHV